MIAYRFEASFAGVPLEIVSWTTDLGRDLVQWRPARGKGSQLQDRGQRPRQYDLQVVLTGTPNEIASKRDRLITISELGTARTFVHPVDGEVICRMTSFTESVNVSEASFRVTLVEDVPFANRRRQDTTTTIQDVNAAADDYDTAVEAMTDDIEVPDSSSVRAVAEAWNESPPTGQAMEADLAPIRSEHSAARASLESARSLEAYNVAVRLNIMAGTLQRFAWAVEQQADRTTSLRLDSAAPLIQVLAQFYGAELANRLVTTVATLNAIKNPLRVAAGTVLKLPLEF